MNPSFYYHLGQAYEKAEKRELARQHFAGVPETAPTFAGDWRNCSSEGRALLGTSKQRPKVLTAFLLISILQFCAKPGAS